MAGKRKWSFTALAMMTSLSLMLGACSKSNSNAEVSSEGASPSGSQAASNAKPEETYELTMSYILFGGSASDADLVAKEVSKITKEKINTTVKLLPISVAAYTQQVNLMLTGNEKLDIVGLFPPMNYPGLVSKESLIPMDELLEKYGQGIKEAMGSEILKASQINGQTYAIASSRPYSQNYGITMRKDLVEKYQFDLTKIKTWTDLEPIFQTIKDKEPGVYPLVKPGPFGIVDAIMFSKFDYLGGNGIGGLVSANNDNQLVDLYGTKDYSDTAAMVRKWYQAGYMQKDIATSQDTGGSLLKAGKAFSMITNLTDDTGPNQREAGQPMVNVILTEPITNVLDVTVFMDGIAKNSKNPEKAMQFLNLMYTDKDVQNMMKFGIEGKHYVKKGDFIAKPEGVQDVGYMGPPYSGNAYLESQWEGSDPQLLEKSKKRDESSYKSKGLGFMFDESAVKSESAAVTNVINQYGPALNVGAIDPEKALPEMLAKLKDAGADKVITEKQNQFDAFQQANP